MSQRLSATVQRLIAREMKSGRYSDENQLLKHALSALIEQRRAVVGIQSGLDDAAAGRMRSRKAFTKAVRKRHSALDGK